MTLIKLNLSGHENETLTAQGYVTLCLQVDLSDSELPQKIVEFLSNYITSGDVVTCVLPGLAPLAAITLAAIHGISGSWATITPMIRGTDGFTPGDPLDLQDFRNNVARSKGRANVITL